MKITFHLFLIAKGFKKRVVVTENINYITLH